MTIAQKILAKHAGLEEVTAGQLITAKVDITLANDITGPVAIKEFKKIGVKNVFDKERVVFVPDHFVPNKDIKSALCCKPCFAVHCFCLPPSSHKKAKSTFLWMTQPITPLKMMNKIYHYLSANPKTRIGRKF